MHTRANSKRNTAADRDVSDVRAGDLERVAVCKMLV